MLIACKLFIHNDVRLMLLNPEVVCYDTTVLLLKCVAVADVCRVLHGYIFNLVLTTSLHLPYFTSLAWYNTHFCDVHNGAWWLISVMCENISITVLDTM